MSAISIQHEVKGKKSLKRAMCCAEFSILNEIFLLPILIAIIIHLSSVITKVPGEDDPGSNYLCQCCDIWHDEYYCCA